MTESGHRSAVEGSLAIFREDDFEDVDPDSPPQPEADHARSGNRRAAKVLLIGLLVVGLAVGGGVAFYLSRINSAISGIERADLLPPRAPAPAALPVDPPLNIVLMGSDSRGNQDIGRSDVLMIAHIPADHSKVYLISFPRDMWVDIPGRGKGKINWGYAFGGPPLTVATLDQLLDNKMDHPAVIDFVGFIALTDALGGVDVYNKRAFTGEGHSFPAGTITLRGEEALAYVRERHNLPNGDLDRAENQRDVVRAIIDKAARPSVLANPVAVNEMLATMADNITVDQDLTNDRIRELATSMKVTSGKDVVSFQAPITGFGRSGDQAIAVVDEAQMAELAKALREDKVDEYLARFPKSCTGPNC